LKLFAIYIGGEMAGANIEVHDVRFVAAASIEATYGALRRQWWGTPGSLHIDCWAQIGHADGFDVELRAEPFAGPERLYFVHLGGYAPGEFAEQHRSVFVVAPDQVRAKRRAIRHARDWDEPHRDDIYEAEQAFDLSLAAADERWHIHLRPNPAGEEPRFTCQYLPIPKSLPKS
jgi:hypothetical protein